MNKLKELIQKLCPNGVEYKKLADCCVLEKGNTPIQKAIPGEFPLVVTTEERKSCNTYQLDKPAVCIPLVSSRGHGVASLNRLYYQEGKFALGNILCGVTPINSDELSAKFLFYYLNHKKDTLIVPLMRGGANVSLTVDSLKRVKVPIPPLLVQNEIVRIFDQFESLANELSAELKARKEQYKYYRDKLLSFDDTVEILPLAQIADIGTGSSNTNEGVGDGLYPFYVRSQEPLTKNALRSCFRNILWENRLSGSRTRKTLLSCSAIYSACGTFSLPLTVLPGMKFCLQLISKTTRVPTMMCMMKSSRSQVARTVLWMILSLKWNWSSRWKSTSTTF